MSHPISLLYVAMAHPSPRSFDLYAFASDDDAQPRIRDIPSVRQTGRRPYSPAPVIGRRAGMGMIRGPAELVRYYVCMNTCIECWATVTGFLVFAYAFCCCQIVQWSLCLGLLGGGHEHWPSVRPNVDRSMVESCRMDTSNCHSIQQKTPSALDCWIQRFIRRQNWTVLVLNWFQTLDCRLTRHRSIPINSSSRGSWRMCTAQGDTNTSHRTYHTSESAQG